MLILSVESSCDETAVAVTCGRKVLSNEIASSLGGRAAEEIFLNRPFNYGACADVQNATNAAKEAVLSLALDKESETGINRVYSMEDYLFMSKDKKEKIDAAIDKLLLKGYERAKQIINENKELIEILVQKLLKEEILTKPEIERIIKKYEKSKNN